jgi:soluble lytic murein transglycosylase
VAGRAARAASAAALAAVLLAAAFGARSLTYALYPFPYQVAVRVAARRAGIDPRLVLAVMRTESRFRPDAVSRRGAVGLMQLTPATAAWAARAAGLPPPAGRLPDPAYNIALGTWYLAHLRHLFGGRLVPALAAYNAGPGPVDRWLLSGRWRGTAADSDRIPYAETRAFVQRVLGTWSVYRWLYGAASGRGSAAVRPGQLGDPARPARRGPPRAPSSPRRGRRR